MALSIVGSSAEVLTGSSANPSFEFVPDSTWAMDDILCVVVGISGTSPTITAISDSFGEDRAYWHYGTVAGSTKVASNNFTYYTLWARVPAAWDGLSTHVTVALTLGGTVNDSVILPGQAVRGAKRVKSRHCPASVSDTNDYNIPSAGASPQTATLPAHAPGSNTGTAGALEVATGDHVVSSSIAGYGTLMTFGSGTVTEDAVHLDYRGTRDLMHGAGYRLWDGANTPVTETAASFRISGWTTGSRAPNIHRFMFILDVNVAPTATIVEAPVTGNDVNALFQGSDYEDAVEATGVYPPPDTEVDWGDGGPTDTLPLADGSSEALAHTYAAPGTYTITLTVTDENGLVDTDTTDVTVAGPATTLGPRYEIKTRRVHARELPYGVTQRMWNETVAGR